MEINRLGNRGAAMAILARRDSPRGLPPAGRKRVRGIGNQPSLVLGAGLAIPGQA